MTGKSEVFAGVETEDCTGMTALITGSTDGIGRQAALALGRLGATVLVHGRSEEKAQRVVEEIEATAGTASAFTADFSSLAEVRQLASEVQDAVDEVDVLANNAGTYFQEGWLTDDGVEATLAINHLAPFVLTHELLPAIPTDGRIITTASGVHTDGELDPDQLTTIDEYDGLEAYARSKLANVLFTRELARRLEERTATCFHPGLVPGSALWRNAPIYVRGMMGVLSVVPNAVTRQVIDTPATGAATLVYLAVSDAVAETTGAYFADCTQRAPSETAQDDDLAERLWERSEALASIDTAATL